MATEFSKKLRETYRSRESQGNTFASINATHAKFRKRKAEDRDTTPQVVQLDEKTAEALKTLYQNAFVAAAEEVRLITDCIERMKKFASRRDAKDKKRKDDKEEPSSPPPPPPPPPRSSSTRQSSSSSIKNTKGDVWSHDHNNPISSGSEVAALVDADSKPKLWILATVLNYISSPRPKYDVVDADPGDDQNPVPRKKYSLPPNKIIPLPTLEQAPWSKRREFGKNQQVLALFPVGGITVLYPALVIKPPKAVKNGKYLLEFDDDDGEHREVDPRYVCPLSDEFAD